VKKIIAILLLAVYLFNLAGYTLVFRYFISQSEAGFISQLDQEKYNEAELIEVSIPLHLPYVQNNSQFERVDGSLENGGIQYNYVKRRIQNDTMYIMCLPNQQKNLLVKGKSNYAGEANDFSANKKNKGADAKKAVPAAEYNNYISQYAIVPPVSLTTATLHTAAASLLNRATGTPEHPPKTAC
jgi:hypothetical protein